MNSNFSLKIHLPLLVFGLAAPFLFPGLQYQIATLWVMVLFALTWDVMGGQMGYNSLGNIFFFGVGMYASAVIQIAQFTDVGAFTAARGEIVIEYTDAQYYQASCSGFWRRALSLRRRHSRSAGQYSACAARILPLARLAWHWRW